MDFPRERCPTAKTPCNNYNPSRWMHLAVRSAKLAVHIAQQRRREQRVIERGVKVFLRCSSAGLNLDDAESCVPLLASRPWRRHRNSNPGISACRFLRAPSTLTVDKPTRTRICSPALVLKSKWPLVSLPVVCLPGNVFVGLRHAGGVKWPGKFHHEIINFSAAPAIAATIAAGGVIILNGELRFVHVVADAVLQIHNHMWASVAAGKCSDGTQRARWR